MSECRALAVIPKTVPVHARIHPLRVAEELYYEAPLGSSILDIVGKHAAYSVEVLINGVPVKREDWPYTIPLIDDVVNIRLFPQGNVGKYLTIAVGIALVAFGGPLGVTIGQGLLISSAIGIVSNLLIPPPKAANAGPAATSLMSITGSSNQANQFGPVPIVLGSVSFFPSHAALPYTEILGDDQYLHVLLDLGYGVLDLGDVTVGGSDLTTLDEVEYEVGQTPSLYTNDINETQLQLDFSTDGEVLVQTLHEPCEEWSFDLYFPSGLFGVDSKGNLVGATFHFYVFQASTGTTNFQPIDSAQTVTPSSAQGSNGSPGGGSFSVYSNSRNPFRIGFRISSVDPTVQYDIQLTRISTIFDVVIPALNGVDSCQLSAIRSIKHTVPSTLPTTKLAIRFKADTESQGVIQQIQCNVQHQIPVYNPITMQWVTKTTSNPAWLAYWLLTVTKGIARNLDPSQLYFPDWVAFANYCDTKGFTYNAVLDSVQTLEEQVRDILGAGRGSITRRDGGYGIVIDQPQTVPTDYFTPFTMSDFTATRSYAKLPHAIKASFINPEASWQQDQIIVLADGYAWDFGSGPMDCYGNPNTALPIASIFQSLDLKGVTSPVAAWQICRYQLNASYYRRNTYTATIDIQSLRVQRGDLVSVQHDVMQWGLGSGRINGVIVPNQQVTLTEKVTYPVGQTLAAMIRSDTGGTCTVNVIPVDPGNTGQANQFAFADANNNPTPTPIVVGIDDIVLIGLPLLVTRQLIVASIQRTSDFAATLTMTGSDARVWNSDQGTQPPFVSTITNTPWEAPPPAPTNLVVISSALNSPTDDAGVTKATTLASVGRASGYVNIINPAAY